MAKLVIHRVPVLRDNYVWLAHEASSNLTAAVDPAVVGPVLAALNVQGWSLTHILNSITITITPAVIWSLKKRPAARLSVPVPTESGFRDRC